MTTLNVHPGVDAGAFPGLASAPTPAQAGAVLASVAAPAVPAAPTPSQSIIAAAAEARRITDARGRVLTLRKLAPLDKMRLFGAAGSELSTNPMYMGYAMLAAHVAAINDEAIGIPTSKLKLEALVHRFTEEDFEAIGEAFRPVDAA